MGLDIGSTTVKAVVLDESGRMCYSKYERHNARVPQTLAEVFGEIGERLKDGRFSLTVTGSVGLGVAERSKIDFIQEVVASTAYVRRYHPSTATVIDIGGEDAKVVFINDGGAPDMRMNGNCAGGTGAFIDQMAVLLNTTPEGLDELARNSSHIYPIASRCGVFAKTDIQNLVAKNATREDIAASIFHAVAVQTVVTLSHGCDIRTPVLFCGGPLAFLPSLRKAFVDYLHLSEEEVVMPSDAQLLPAWGAAIMARSERRLTAREWNDLIAGDAPNGMRSYDSLQPIFGSDGELASWREAKNSHLMVPAPLHAGRMEMLLGIDSGSTTTKIVAIDRDKHLLFSYYTPNDGNPIAAVERGLRRLAEECAAAGTDPVVCGGCSTGYGEDLIKAAFRLDYGIIETIAHYIAAREITPDVSFILDIGGQDIKAIFVDRGVLTRMEINEACSSGCGSFIETFAKSLGYSVADFAALACTAEFPCDLGTRCTVFMNSKVKQVLREGASIADIAAGLSYSVVKNCLYKVLKFRSADELGERVVVQGGTMRNDAVVRAFERLTEREVFRSERPELMGAFGCALYARDRAVTGVALDEILEAASYTSRTMQCHGCENGCMVTRYRFANGNDYFSGNKCERHFSNRGDSDLQGRNAYAEKLHLLFDRPECRDGRLTVGIPRCLNLYEEYPFWHTLLYNCGIRVVLSEASNMASYENNVRKVMSDNICFPAKLVHSHIAALAERGVDRILMPYVIYERMEDNRAVNSYNCPIVSGYSDVVRSVENLSVPLDTPTVSFRSERLLRRQCVEYLRTLGVDRVTALRAFRLALAEYHAFSCKIKAVDEEIVSRSHEAGRLTIILAGRPYHADPLIQHKLSDMIASMGVDLITDDIVRGEQIDTVDTHFVSQWAYPNRILRAAEWCVRQGSDVQLVQMTSFGCGPDALLTDEVRDLLGRYGKSFALLKIDDVSNIGSLKLRVRSLIESLKLGHCRRTETRPFVTTPVFDEKDRHRKILIPFFTPFISPLIPHIVARAGYDVESLPASSAYTAEMGLKYANNEICYPATLIVGDMIAALQSGRYDVSHTAVAISQTGGQCRASNYISLIKKALVEAGFADVPVISVSPGSGLKNAQPGFRIPWRKLLRSAVGAVIFTDCLARLYYPAAVRETEAGSAAALRDKYMDEAVKIIRDRSEGRQIASFRDLLSCAAEEFSRIVPTGVDRPKVGIVGEIYLKFNPFAQKGLTEWLVEQKIEVVSPVLADFFMQGFVNRDVKLRTGLEKSRIPDWLMRRVFAWMQGIIDSYNAAASRFEYFRPLGNIYHEAAAASKIISLNARFGEGWLLPGEIATFAMDGVNNVVSLQPFGCIANHIVAKGVEKRIKTLYPQMNLLSLDFDGSVSDVNITNRLLLFIYNLKKGERQGK